MKIAEEALELMGVGYLKDEAYTEISGGERQLVLIARAIAQESDYLIMDEPTSNLDFGNGSGCCAASDSWRRRERGSL